MKPRIYADFQNADELGRIRLNNQGTLDDVAKHQIVFHDGMAVTLYSDDVNAAGDEDELEVDGIVGYADVEKCWVASIDWNAIHHASDVPNTNCNGTSIPVSPVLSDANVTRR